LKVFFEILLLLDYCLFYFFAPFKLFFIGLLIENYSGERKIIIASHHIGFFSILANWLTKGEKSEQYKNISELYILSKDKEGSLSLENIR